MPAGVSYSVGREKTTLPEGEPKRASGRRLHLSQDLRKQSRQKHYRDRELRPKLPTGLPTAPRAEDKHLSPRGEAHGEGVQVGNHSWGTSNQLGEKCEPLPRGLQLCTGASLSLPQLGTQTTEKRGVRWEQEEPGDSFPGKKKP